METFGPLRRDDGRSASREEFVDYLEPFISERAFHSPFGNWLRMASLAAFSSVVSSQVGRR